MDATPILVSSLAIQVHALSAILAMLLGTTVHFLRKGTPLHKRLGRTWVGIMAVVALSSFLITEVRMFGPYSFIHALSLFTLISLVAGVAAIRSGHVKVHRFIMISLYAFALVLTGAFTLLPGRRMNAVIFADGGQTAAWLAAFAAVAMWMLLLSRRRHSRA